MPQIVIKRNKIKEPYHPSKIIKSLEKLKVSRDKIEEILFLIDKNLPSLVTTDQLFRFIYDYLKRDNGEKSYRYNLKKAILALGPTGYPFEKFIAHLLSFYGYQTKHNLFLEGKCLKYEIDILAELEGKIYIGECKFRHYWNKKNDLHVVLYSYARYLDLKNNFSQESYPLIVTNTKFTQEGIKFSTCYGIKLISWNYPPTENLVYLIEFKKIYPLTIFDFISLKNLKNLFNNDIILVSDFISKDKNYLRKISGLSLTEIDKIFQESKKII